MAEEAQTNTSGTKPFSFWERMREISMFFDGTDRVHQTMRHVVEKLDRAGIPYAVAGGMAVNAHKHVRTTGDVDLLLTEEGLATFLSLFVPAEFTRVAGH